MKRTTLSPPVSVTDFAKIKGCSRQTIYNNLLRFTIKEGRIIWDAKAKKWKPDESKCHK